MQFQQHQQKQLVKAGETNITTVSMMSKGREQLIFLSQTNFPLKTNTLIEH